MKITMCLLSRLAFSLQTWGRMACGALVITALHAEAYTCGFEGDIFHENLIIPVVGPGLSTIGEDVPVGQIIYTGRYLASNRGTAYYCKIEAGEGTYMMHTYSKIDIIATPSGVPTLSDEKNIFPTNVPGIGAIFYLTGPSLRSAKFPILVEREAPVSNGSLIQNMSLISIIEVELIKTGPIPPGTHQVLSSSFPTFQITAGSRSPVVEENVFVTLNFNGAMTMYTKTCQLTMSVVDVALGRYQRTNFRGIGTVTPWKEFDITLRDCPAFVGYGGVYSYLEPSDTTVGSNIPNKSAIAFNSVHGIVNNNPLLAKLESGPTAADGIGIEVSERNNEVSLSLDGSEGLNLQNLPTEDSSNYTIQLKARYVQYESEVKAGIANGAAVFTITYN